MNLSNGTLIRLARIGKGWTLDILAEKSGYSISYLSKIENDERDVPDIIKHLLNLDAGPQWYFDIVDAISEHFSQDSANRLINSFHNAIGLKSWQF
jgi:transcriptional regulator with XRE-family HTH domain